MPYKAFSFKGFGAGLNLRDGPDVVEEDQAIDARNVIFTERGTVKQRSGYGRFNHPIHANALAAYYKTDGTKHLLISHTSTDDVTAVQADGTFVASTTAPTTSPHYFQRFGGPTAEHLYFANGTDTVRRWTGSAFETPTYTGTTPTGKFLGLSTTDNRLVNARFSGTTAGNNPSTVRFSVEADPLTWNTDDYVDVTPGDGEEIMGVAQWRNLVFVFKQTKFFVFYGQSVDDDGAPVFNYRPVESNAGLAAPNAIAVTPQGIYFLDRKGVYFTAGQQAVLVSELVEPIFRGGTGASPYYNGGALNYAAIAQSTMVYHGDRVWLSFPAAGSSTNNRQLVFDPKDNWWTLFEMPAGPMTNFRIGDRDELVFGNVSLARIHRYIEGLYVNDDVAVDGSGGTFVPAAWQSGWLSYGTQAVKVLREFRIMGTGVVTVEIFRDHRHLLQGSGTLFTGVQLGINTVQPKLLRKSVRGEVFSVRLYNNTVDTSFSVHGFTSHLRDVRGLSAISSGE